MKKLVMLIYVAAAMELKGVIPAPLSKNAPGVMSLEDLRNNNADGMRDPLGQELHDWDKAWMYEWYIQLEAMKEKESSPRSKLIRMLVVCTCGILATRYGISLLEVVTNYGRVDNAAST